MRNFHSICCLVVSLGVAACESPLLVDNRSQPDRNRALSTPADVETFIANSYNTVHNATLGANDALQPGLLVMGLENYSGNANFQMNVRGAIPRSAIDNSRGNAGENIHQRDWTFLHRAARSAALGLAALNRGVTFTTPPGGPRDQRNRAFAYFVMGLGTGYLAMVYDSVTLMRWDDPPLQTDYPLMGYNAGMNLALAYLDTAITLAQGATDGFPLPVGWLNGNTSSAAAGTISTQAQFIAFIRSYKARFRAGVARNPADRATVDWNAVIADAQAGITRDYQITTSPAAGWDVVWPAQHYLFQSWGQMVSYIIGMADVSGEYDAWLANPTKRAFLIQTPDRRFPAGATRGTQQANSALFSSTSPPPPGLYFRNRPGGEDVITANTLANSFYDHYRFTAWRNSTPTRTGTFPVMTRAEMNGLIAEGAIRTNQWTLATQYIDSSRTRNGLPSVGGIADLTTPVPGGGSCVPRVPNPATNYTSAICGNLFEAMKWEYRMETAFTGYGNWYFAGRGWGDLPEGTPIHYPVPYQELDVREKPSYNVGGVGLPGGAARGAYGL